MLVLYAVVRADAPPPLLALPRLDHGRVAVLYAERATAPPAERDEVLAFGESLRSLPPPILPFRFGTTLADELELTALAEEREESWVERLEVVDGQVEVVVHVLDDEPDRAAAPTSGREYLMAKTLAHQQEEALSSGACAALDGLARETRTLPAAHGVRLAVLVPADGLEELWQRLDAWATRHPGRQVSTTGPWPPFSFTDAGEAA